MLFLRYGKYINFLTIFNKMDAKSFLFYYPYATLNRILNTYNFYVMPSLPYSKLFWDENFEKYDNFTCRINDILPQVRSPK